MYIYAWQLVMYDSYVECDDYYYIWTLIMHLHYFLNVLVSFNVCRDKEEQDDNAVERIKNGFIRFKTCKFEYDATTTLACASYSFQHFH